MKKLLPSIISSFALIITLFQCSVYGQTLLNGDFEINEVDTCGFNFTNEEFNDTISFAYSYGIEEQADLMTFDCHGDPQSGDWCLGLSSRPSGGHDAVNIELSSALTPGLAYELRFWAYSNTSFNPSLDTLKIGTSSNNNTFGQEIFRVVPAMSVWTEYSTQFVASAEINFISIAMSEYFNSGWSHVDNFSIEETTIGIEENFDEATFSLYPNPATDVLNIELKDVSLVTKVSIISIAGQLLFDENYNSSIKKRIDVSDYPSGVYIVRMQSAQGEEQLKMVKL